MLALDAAHGPAIAAVVEADRLLAQAAADDAKSLPQMVAGLPLDGVAAVAVTVGPGSFTGLRAALSLAHGFALARGIPLVAVSVAEALAEAVPPLGGRSLWVAIDSRRQRLFLDRGDGMRAMALSEIEQPGRPVAIAGDYAREVASLLAARGADVMLTDTRRPGPHGIAQAARRRLAGELPGLAAVPIYVDPPAARLP